MVRIGDASGIGGGRRCPPGRSSRANKKLPSLTQGTRVQTPVVPPFLSHLWPVTARGYFVHGDHPFPPTCSPLSFLRRTARWRVRGNRSIRLASFPDSLETSITV